MSSLKIDIGVYGGANIPDEVIPEMVALAERLQISVWADLNGVRTLAQPGDSSIQLAIQWREASERGGNHAYASTSRVIAKPNL